MAYWRMQLHPSESNEAVKHTVESLAAGYVGLDFAGDIPDLFTVNQEDLPDNQRNYWAFAHEINIDDRVLLFAHHFPFALARISGSYNFIRSDARKIGVWFRHFRAIDDVRYYGDYITNAKTWDTIAMTGTIAPLRDPTSASHQLVDRWLR